MSGWWREEQGGALGMYTLVATGVHVQRYLRRLSATASAGQVALFCDSQKKIGPQLTGFLDSTK